MHLDRTDPRHGTVTRASVGTSRRVAVALGTAIVLVVAAACAAEPEGEGASASPTFERATGASFAIEKPVASPTDLVAPTTDDEPWAIVGSTYAPDDAVTSATVWTSEDGREWTADQVGSTVHGSDVSIAAAERGADGIVAVGRAGSGDEADVAVWTQDGDDWSASTPDEMGGEHEQWGFDVATGPGGVLVAGGDSVWGDIRPRLWFSPDGSTWTSVDGGAGGVFDETGEESVRDVAAVGDGFVAVGTRTLEGEQDGVVWFSPDGESWEQLDAPTLGGEHRQDVLAVTAVDGGAVAGGLSDTDGDGQGEPVTWLSEDGRTWSDPNGPLKITSNVVDAYDLAVRSLSTTPQGVIIAAGGNEWRPRVWRSDDGGMSWEETPDPVRGDLFQDGVALRAAGHYAGETIAIGATPAVMRLVGKRWEDATSDAFPAGGAKPIVTAVAEGTDRTIAAGGLLTAARGEKAETHLGQIWARKDDSWTTIDSKRLAAGQITDATAFAGGFVAVGYENFGLAKKREQLVEDGLPDGLVWISPNGKDWGRIGVKDARVQDIILEHLSDPSNEGNAAAIAGLEADTPPLSVEPAGGDGTRSLNAVAPLGKGYVAVGSKFEADSDVAAEPIILTSADGMSYTGENPQHGGAGSQTYEDVCTGRDDTAVAVGVSQGAAGADVIAATRSPDGWVAAEGPFGGPGDQKAYACAAGEDGFVIVGYDDQTGNRDARVWTSEDGREWTEQTSSLLGGSGEQWASAAAAVPSGGWLVAGTDGGQGDGDIALWRIDADGEISRRDLGEPALGGPGEQTVSSVTVDADGHVTLAGGDYGRAGLWESDTLDR